MLGFVELVDVFGQYEIALGQAVGLVRPHRNLDSSPGKHDAPALPRDHLRGLQT